jgi:hypothetical protein
MSRVQLALNVADLDDAIAFYSKLFGTTRESAPAINFVVTEPPLKLILIAATAWDLNVFGSRSVDGRSRSNPAAARERGTLTATETVSCCYAVQDKVWVTAPTASRRSTRALRRRWSVAS